MTSRRRRKMGSLPPSSPVVLALADIDPELYLDKHGALAGARFSTDLRFLILPILLILAGVLYLLTLICT